jgi:serine/threonine protein phosphatase PrpC
VFTLTNEWDSLSIPHLYKKELTQEQLDYRSGTTLLVTMITSTDIHVIWVGDSRCIFKTDVYEPNEFGSTTDHKPNMNDLISKNSFITNGRLNGILAVGRTIGDNTPELIGCINRAPSSLIVAYKKTFRVILATDGLYDIIPMKKIQLYIRSVMV